jgi:cytoplasmic iron level regulating protein YaaA (DUF328/UPF0246 family)
MITLISPAKTLDLSTTEIEVFSTPDFQKETTELVSIMKKKSVEDIKKMMGVSDNIAELNEKRYRIFKKTFESHHAKQAILTFNGDVYTKIEVDKFSEEDFEFAQQHLRILSGLYGLLKPMDLIQPYRLEMGTKLKNKKGKNLYQFWGKRIGNAIQEVAQKAAIVNLASHEYFRAVDQSSLTSPVITPVFQEFRNGQQQTIGLFAKQARGMMTNFIIKNKITDPEKLKVFNEGGYQLSDAENWVFVR